MRGILRILFFFAIVYFLLSAIRGIAQAFFPRALEKRKRLTRIDDPLERPTRRDPPTTPN